MRIKLRRRTGATLDVHATYCTTKPRQYSAGGKRYWPSVLREHARYSGTRHHFSWRSIRPQLADCASHFSFVFSKVSSMPNPAPRQSVKVLTDTAINRVTPVSSSPATISRIPITNAVPSAKRHVQESFRLRAGKRARQYSKNLQKNQYKTPKKMDDKHGSVDEYR